jgi:hypothetical protein
MDKSTLGILAFILALIWNIIWWFRSKGTPYRKTILVGLICYAVTIISGFVAMKFELLPFYIFCIIAFFTTIFFIVKAMLAENRFKKKSFPD